ncbi:hypothetical protein [Sphingorhabdus lutea]|nr:hypothetical protein [Sphingorhabdus lutea]
MLKKMLLILSLTSFSASPILAQPMYTNGNRPVTLHAMDDMDACSLGAITDQGPEGAVLVFSGDSNELEAFDNLTSGQAIWVCDNSEENDMVGIVYSHDGETDCEVSSPILEDMDYTGPCSSGWIMSDAVEVIAG